MVLRLMQRFMTPFKSTLWKILLTRFSWTHIPCTFKWPSIFLYPVLGKSISISLRTASNSWSVTVEYKLDTDNENSRILLWAVRTLTPKHLAMSVTEKVWGETLAGQSRFETLVYLASQNIQPYFWGLRWSRSICRQCKLCWRSFMQYEISLSLYRLAAHFILNILGSQFYFATIQYYFLKCVHHLGNFSFLEQMDWCDLEPDLQFPSKNNWFINEIRILQSDKDLTRFWTYFYSALYESAGCWIVILKISHDKRHTLPGTSWCSLDPA